MSAVSVDINLEKFYCFVLNIYESEAISFSEDGKSFLSGVEVVQIQRGDLRGSSP